MRTVFVDAEGSSGATSWRAIERRNVIAAESAATALLDGLVVCMDCGCVSGELGRDWAAYISQDPDDELDPPAIAVYCRPCAASEFDHRPDAADAYV